MDFGLKLNETDIRCPYCDTVNHFEQGEITKPCQYCHRGFFRRPVPVGE